MTTISLPSICLDIAIDHRIKRLCKPTLQPTGVLEPSEHLSIIQQHGIRLGRKPDEIKVTSQLAGPATTGGILVTLSQPRYTHPYDKGLDTVIQDCETFSALGELFKVASCGTLTLQQHVSLIDLLPFTPQRVEVVSSRELEDAFEASRLAICAKRPDVVLCAGRIWIPKEDENSTTGTINKMKDELKGGLQKLEARGVGQLDTYDAVGLQGIGPELVVMSRVNGFHPSYAMNYLPEHTSLRQLLLLNVVKTCGLYRDDWQEVRWMDALRAECFGLTNKLQEKKKRARRLQTRGLERILSGRSRTLSDYVQIYSAAQENFVVSINRIEHLQSKAAEGIYENILASRISSKCNDASVVLRGAWELSRRGWLEAREAVTLRCITEISLEVRLLVDRFAKKPLKAQNGRLQEIIEVGMVNLRACFSYDDTEPAFNLEMSADVFLQMALSVEEMLGDLLEAEYQGRSENVGAINRVINEGPNNQVRHEIINLD